MSFTREQLKSAGCAVAYIAIAMLICFFLSLLFSCKARYITQEVPVVLHERDSIVKVQQVHTHDTLVYRDSVFHLIKGDTVLIERWHTLQAVNHIARIDTLWRERVVEQPVQVTTTEIKEVNRLRWWQKALMWMGGIAMIVIGCGAYWKFRH